MSSHIFYSLTKKMQPACFADCICSAYTVVTSLGAGAEGLTHSQSCAYVPSGPASRFIFKYIYRCKKITGKINFPMPLKRPLKNSAHQLLYNLRKPPQATHFLHAYLRSQAAYTHPFSRPHIRYNRRCCTCCFRLIP